MRLKNERNFVQRIFYGLQNFGQLLQRAGHEELEVGQLGANGDDCGQLVVGSGVEPKLQGSDPTRPRSV